MVLRNDNQGESKLDWLKWLIAFTLLFAAIVANHYYSDITIWLRLVGWAIVVPVTAFIAAKTQKGKWVVEFVRDSRVELRKVIWPTREETMQTTMVVAAMVVILAIILWGLDGVLVWLIGWLTGQHS